MNNLRETELRYKAIFEQSPYGILLIDSKGNITDFNETAHRDLGYSREEFSRLGITDIDPFQCPEEVEASVREVLKKGSAEFAVKHITKHGDIRDVRVITQVLDLSGQKYFQTIWHDVTEKKRAEEELARYREHLEELVTERTNELSWVNERLQKDIAERKKIEEMLRESEERFRRIFEDGPLGMIIVNRRNKIDKVNRAMCRMLGYECEDLAGRGLNEITYPEDREKSEKLFRQAIKGEIPVFQSVERHVRKSGEIVWTNLTAATIRDHGGKVLYVIGMIEDINERKLAEEVQENLIFELKDALAKIKTLTGLIPICAWCKKIRDDKGYWKKVETYIREHSDASFTHGICPDCLRKESPETYEEVFKNNH